MKRISNMKNNILFKMILPVFLLFALMSCNDWTEVEEKDILESGQSEEYYENLRAWKSTFRDREISFGWFGNWLGVGASLANTMAGIPDSMDMISLWGPWAPHTFDAAKKADFDNARKVKGLKVLACSFAMNVGDGMTPGLPEGLSKEERIEYQKEWWGWKEGDKDSMYEAIRKYAKAFADSVNMADFDGFDIDYEPHFGGAGNLASTTDLTRMHAFVEELGKYFGPKSGTGKILTIDGEPHFLLPETGLYFDYFIEQTYNEYSDDRLDENRIRKCFDNYKDVMSLEEIAAKYICTENFEDHALNGGVSYTTRDKEKVRSLKGFAMWTPKYGGEFYRKGGCGVYHMEYEYYISGKPGFYPYMREAIRIMNPAETNNK